MEWQLTIFRQFKTAPGPGTTARTPEVDPSYKSGHCHHTLLGRRTLIRQHARYHDKVQLGYKHSSHDNPDLISTIIVWCTCYGISRLGAWILLTICRWDRSCGGGVQWNICYFCLTYCWFWWSWSMLGVGCYHDTKHLLRPGASDSW